MEPANKKQRRSDSSLCVDEEKEEIRRALTEKNEMVSLLEARNAELVLQREAKAAKVTSLEARVAELEATVTALEEKYKVKQLPSDIWARILDFSVYSDVARMARVSRSFLHEVMPHLKSLYLDDEGAITVQQARRFQSGNVEELIIDCIFFGSRVVKDRCLTFKIKEHAGRDDEFVRFLSHFPNCRYVLFGNGECETKSDILRRLHVKRSSTNGYELQQGSSWQRPAKLDPAGENNVRIYKSMLYLLSYAYRASRISPDLIFYGLPSGHSCTARDCLVCHDVCLCFPLSQVASLIQTRLPYFPHALGEIRADQKVEWIVEREVETDYLRPMQETLFLSLLQSYGFANFFNQKSAIGHFTIVMETMNKLKARGCEPRSLGIQ
jgi:hypothetical protein